MLGLIIKIVFCAIMFACATALIIVKYGKWQRRKRNCTREMTVKVTQILEKKTARSGIIYKPVFESVDPMDQAVIDSAFYTRMVTFNVGETVELLINPDNVKEFLYKNDALNKGKIADLMACLIVCAVAVGGSIALMLS